MMTRNWVASIILLALSLSPHPSFLFSLFPFTFSPSRFLVHSLVSVHFLCRGSTQQQRKFPNQPCGLVHGAGRWPTALEQEAGRVKIRASQKVPPAFPPAFEHLSQKSMQRMEARRIHTVNQAFIPSLIPNDGSLMLFFLKSFLLLFEQSQSVPLPLLCWLKIASSHQSSFPFCNYY